LNLTTLKFQYLGDLVESLGRTKESVCTFCWDGVEVSSPALPFPDA
jgi:hypothetical protein